MNAEQAWQATLGQLQMEMSKAAFDTWVRSTELLSYSDGLFTVRVQNTFARDWLEDRLTSTLCRMLAGMVDRSVNVEFVVWQKESIQPVTENNSDQEIPNEPINRPTSLTINPRYAFDNFVVGASNRLAHAACMAVAENPAHSYNPLFLYGGVGLGKTHLLHAIGNKAQEMDLQVLYVSSEEFTNDLISAIRAHTTPTFREKYRQIDVLLIDDIQFISGKESTQEEFFHTFNTLHGQDKQIVMTSDRPPKAMVTLEERLRSRFEWGLIADIQPPDLETRIAILSSKADRAGKKVPSDILEGIAHQVQSNIRELEGALTRVLALSDLSGIPLSPQLVSSSLADLMPQRNTLEPSQVVSVVAQTFGVTTAQLTGRDRSHEFAWPRQIAMYLLRELGNFSLPQIGTVIGGRDHTTVMYACEKVADLVERDDRLRRQLILIREQLDGKRPAAA
jgi:chromosomal replication initiator protein